MYYLVYVEIKLKIIYVPKKLFPSISTPLDSPWPNLKSFTGIVSSIGATNFWLALLDSPCSLPRYIYTAPFPSCGAPTAKSTGVLNYRKYAGSSMLDMIIMILCK